MGLVICLYICNIVSCMDLRPTVKMIRFSRPLLDTQAQFKFQRKYNLPSHRKTTCSVKWRWIFCARHKGVWGRGSTLPIILNRSPQWRWIVRFRPRLLYPLRNRRLSPLNNQLLRTRKSYLANRLKSSWYFVDRASQYNLFFFISNLIQCFSVYVQYLLSSFL